MQKGYIPLFRKIHDHPFYKEKRVFSKYEAWIDILMEARHKEEPEQILIGMRSIECGYGQSVKSLRTWGKKWSWSPKKVSRFFVLLEEMGQIRHENVTVTSRITVLNYSKYNIERHGSVTDMSHEGNTKETQVKHERPTNKKDKKEKNEKELKETSKRIIDKLNSLSGKKFRYVDSNTENIIARLKEKFTEQDCIKVLETKIKDPYFMDNPKYYCPKTLFRPSNFEKYLNETPKGKETIVICLDKEIWKNSRYQADGLWETADIIYTNFKPAFIDDDEREEVELNTNKFIEEYCDGGF